MQNFSRISGLLIDLEGVLYSDNKLIKGAIESINTIRKHNFKIRFLTNTTTAPINKILEKLKNFNFDILKEEIFSPIIATRNYLTKNNLKKICLITDPSLVEEFDSFEINQKNPDAIILGDIYKNFNWIILDNAFKLINENNSKLIALHKNKYCKRDGRISLDLGPFVDAIEYASGIKAEVMGKPEKNFFNIAIEDMGVSKNEVVMIGDDIVSDIKGAKDFGIKTIQVKTGKYQENDSNNKFIQPDERIESIVDVVNLLKN